MKTIFNHTTLQTISFVLLLCLSTTTSAQLNKAVLPPIINLILEEPEFSCSFSITPISPAIGSTFSDGEQVLAQVNFELNNVPTEFGINLLPILFAEASNGSRTGVILTTTDSLVIKEPGSNVTNINGQGVAQRTNFFMSNVLFEDLELLVIFNTRRRTIFHSRKHS